jgi:hypothetical protein
MTSAFPDPYLPPGSDLERHVPAVGDKGASARLAGGFLALNAISWAGFSLRNMWPQATAPSMPTVATVAMLVPTAFFLVTDGLLAVPLLRGSVRFRVLTWIRAALSIVFVLLAVSSSYHFLKERSPELAQERLRSLDRRLVSPSLFAATLLLLVTSRPRRWRLVTGLACIAVYAASQFL